MDLGFLYELSGSLTVAEPRRRSRRVPRAAGP